MNTKIAILIAVFMTLSAFPSRAPMANSESTSESNSTSTATSNAETSSDASSSVGDIDTSVAVDAGDAISGSLSTIGDTSSSSETTIGDTANSSSVGDQVTNVTVEGDEQRKTVKIKNTPAAIAPAVYPTVSCFRGGSGSASLPGFGVSLGGGKIDEGCVMRENIRIASQMGMNERALFVWCSQPEVSVVFGSADACLGFAPEVAQARGKM